MDPIPALDLRGGRCVRLLRGDFAFETVYPVDPVELARESARAGARRLHVVDLDAAAGRGDNRDLVERLVFEAGVEVQVAGGVRTEAGAAGWLLAGAAAVVMGTTAVRQPEILAACAAAHPGRVLAALDVRGGLPAVNGWTSEEELGVDELLERWRPAPIAGIVLTSVDRDGTLAGPDLETLRRVLAAAPVPVTYSGGIGSLSDLAAVAAAGASAAILGRALLDGRFTLAEALAAC